MNERITETIVRERFQPFVSQGFIIEEQQSQNPRIAKLLHSASKSGHGIGKPEFIVSHKEDSDFLLVVECKADNRKHVSPTLDQWKDYAVDGALLYSTYLSRDFDVIALGVSGQRDKDLLATAYLQLKTTQKPKLLARELLTLPDFRDIYIYHEDTRRVLTV